MSHPFKSLSRMSLLAIVLAAPMLISGTRYIRPIKTATVVSAPIHKATVLSAHEMTAIEAEGLYESMKLDRAGLNEEAFQLAWQGYKKLMHEGKIRRGDVLTICDFSQSSRNKRMYIIHVAAKKLLMNTFVAHGRNSGNEYAADFSNSMDSHKSSLGFYVTRQTYIGGHGLSLNLTGLEKGINDKAEARKIVVHGAEYVNAFNAKFRKAIGTSFGCPAVPEKESLKIINTIKNGTCLFIYHPSKKYATQSKIINS